MPLKNHIYIGAWDDAGGRKTDDEGEPWKPAIVVTDEPNGYHAWLITPHGTGHLSYFTNRDEAIEYAVERVLRHREEAERSQATGG